MASIFSGFRYSPEQERAIRAVGRDALVSAGAGSGKTTVLVARFLHAVLKENVPPDRILAVTFTEKAAHEMKSRLIEKFESLGRPDLRRKLEDGYIGTIHGFAARVLKENPVEAGVDPFFRILSEGEAEILMDQALDEVFESEPENENRIRLLADYGEGALRAALKELYALERAWGDDPQAFFQIKDFANERKEVEARVVKLSREILSTLEKEKKSLKTDEAAREGIARLLDIFEGSAVRDWDSFGAIEEVDAFFVRKGPRKDDYDEMKTGLARWHALAAAEMAAPFKREFLRMYGIFREIYNAEKRKRALQDFDDLVFLACRKEILHRFRERFLRILLDEYQDTNPIQARLVRFLKKGGNLFAVGDERQAIYGFRHADQRVLRETCFPGGARASHLAENYRSRSEVLQFVNAVFSKIFPSDFTFLKPGKTFSREKPSSVEILCVRRDGEEVTELDEARLVEARSATHYVRRLIESKVEVETDRGARPVRYGDVAILFRRLGASVYYEKELREAGVPVLAVKGRGYYDRPEVRDVVNFLKLIEDPQDDIALAAVLRSPFVGLSDDALFWMARKIQKDQERPLWEACSVSEPMPELAEEDRKRLGDFLGILHDLRRRKDAGSLYAMLETLLARTDYEIRILTCPDGERMRANVRKLVETARLMEEKGLCSIGDFVRYWEALRLSEPKEGEARVESEEEDAVTLSSIHAAKGLEFPFVIVADLGGGEVARGGFMLFSKTHGVGMKLKRPDLPDAYAEDAAYESIQEESHEREKAEEARLLYVAMTRAKEHLVLSGSVSWDPKSRTYARGKNWMARLLEIVGHDPFAGGGSEFSFAGVRVLLPPPAEPEPKTKEPSAKKPLLIEWPIFRRAAEDLSPVDPLEAKQASVGFDERAAGEILSRLVAPAKPYDHSRDLTVTAVAGHSEKAAEKILEDSWDEEGLLGHEYGNIFHRLMEEIARNQEGRWAKSPAVLSFLESLPERDRKEILESAERFWRGEWADKIRRARARYTELPFIYRTTKGILKGQIDLVFRTREGEWVILDYKTSRKADATSASYEFQVGLYAFVFSRLYGERVRRGVLYFSRSDQTKEFFYEPSDLDAIGAKLEEVFARMAVPAQKSLIFEEGSATMALTEG